MKLIGRDIKSSRWIYIKGWLFLLVLIISFIALLFEQNIIKRLLLAICLVWSSARFYYFMFYVIERYVDPSYKFSGIVSFVRYVISKKE
jgi:hypothetical protein